MKYVDFLKLQEEYDSRKEFIKAIKKFTNDFYHNYHSNKDFGHGDSETYHVIEECSSLLKKDIERLKKELNEMEV